MFLSLFGQGKNCEFVYAAQQLFQRQIASMLYHHWLAVMFCFNTMLSYVVWGNVGIKAGKVANCLLSHKEPFDFSFKVPSPETPN